MSTRFFSLILRHGSVLPPPHPPPPLPTLLSLIFLLLFLLSRYFTIFPSCFAHTFLHSFLFSSSASPSLSHTTPLTSSSLQLPEKFSNDLNETPAFTIFHHPPCWILKRTLPCTAIRKPVPGAAAFAVSAWRSSLPSSGTGGGLHKFGSTVSTETEAAAESQEGFPEPSRSLSLCSCPPSASLSPAAVLALFVFLTPKEPQQPLTHEGIQSLWSTWEGSSE